VDVSPIVAVALCIKPRGLLTADQATKVDTMKKDWPEFATMRGLAMRFRGLLSASKLGSRLRDAQKRAQQRRKAAASAVIDAETNLEKLLVEAEAAQQTVLSKRAELMALAGPLPNSSEKRKGIDSFLSRVSGRRTNMRRTRAANPAPGPVMPYFPGPGGRFHATRRSTPALAQSSAAGASYFNLISTERNGGDRNRAGYSISASI
jgi:hypothetical protein